MKLVFTLLLLAGLLLFAHAIPVSQQQEIVVYYPDIKPLKQAILIDIMKETEKHLPYYRLTFRKASWARAYEMASRGLGGIISISMNSDRLHLFDYSDPLYVDEILLVTLNDKSFPFEKIEDLKGKRIGGIRGVSYGNEFEYGKANIFRYDESNGFGETQVQAVILRKLLAGSIDAALISPGLPGLKQTVHDDPQLRSIAHRFVPLPKPLLKSPNHLAFAKELKMTGFLREFNIALAVAQKSGAVKKIIDSHTAAIVSP